MVKVEYLLPFDTTNGICRDVSSFKSLLSSHSDVRVSGNSILYKKSKYDFKVELSVVQDKDCSVFHVTFSCGRLTEKFRRMLRAFKLTIGPLLKDNVQVIWDGVSFEWAKEVYPKIYQVENLMRMLISKFMLITLGVGWHRTSVPKDVEQSILSKSYKPSHAILYEVDFIQLSNFLFVKYSLKDQNKLPKFLDGILEAEELDEEKRNELKDYISRDNWARYFADIVDFESEEFKKKWQRLYEIRCKVAHNRPMIIEDYNEATDLCDTVGEVIEKALSEISSITVSDEDKENVSLRTIATVHTPARDYVDSYLRFRDDLSAGISSNPERFSSVEYSIKALLHS